MSLQKKYPAGSLLLASCLFLFSCSNQTRQSAITGELKQWHKITLTVEGPQCRETDSTLNPFLDYRMTVSFVHESGSPSYKVPGYFAADGQAAETSAQAGNAWRAHLSPDKAGRWHYEALILKGKDIAVSDLVSDRAKQVHHSSGSFDIAESDKSGRDFRAQGRLQYVGERYLRFAGTKKYFLKAGADSPENLLAFADFDGTYSYKDAGLRRDNEAATPSLKTWQAHIQDWRPGDPAWQDEKGKGLIGALNYLAGKGCNAFSFLTYNAGGDGDDVWPFVSHDDKYHYDCSKLDQWQIVFDHAQQLGLYLHFKLQETENDDLINGKITGVPAALDGGELGTERKLYLRELVARFGYQLALNWNLGEENTQTPDQQRAMAAYLASVDPYQHHRVIHSFPDWQDRVYPPLLGDQSMLTGMSMQNGWATCHQRVLYWIGEAERNGKIWVIANDEQNPHYTGVPPDSGYADFGGTAYPEQYSPPYSADDIRKHTLWGVLMAGGAGVEYYFGYTLPQTDLSCQDWRSRDRSWDYCRIALEFFSAYDIPFWEMRNADALIENASNDNSRYCLAKPGEVYVIYLPNGGPAILDLESDSQRYSLQWYNPRAGGGLQPGGKTEIRGPGKVNLGYPPLQEDEDWVALIRRQQ